MTLDDLIAGLIIAASGILVGVIVDTGPEAIRFLVLGFRAPPFDWRKASAPATATGVLCFGALQIYGRWLPVKIDPLTRQWTTLICWALICWGYIVWQSVLIAEKRGPQVAIWWLRAMVAGVIGTMILVANSHAFHSPLA